MKRYILTLICLLTLLPAWAQQGLEIASLFGSKFPAHGFAKEVMLTGKHVKQYKLTLFRSITLDDAHADGALVETKVRADAAHAVEKEVGYKGSRLYYGFFRLPPARKGGPNRFIFYRNNALRKDRKPTLTLVYMEGSARMEDLRRTFMK